MAEDKEQNKKATEQAPKTASKKVAKKAAPKKAASQSKKKKVAKKAKATSAKKRVAPKSGAKTHVARAPLSPKTYFAKSADITPNWRIIDAEGKTLGRLSAYIAKALQGKDKPTYTPHADTGDFVVVVNVEKIRMTGNKMTDKNYFYHTGYAGGVKQFTPKELIEKNPERVLKWAVHGMLPSTHMGRTAFKKLKVYKGAEHPHKAQQPKPVVSSHF